MHGQPAVWVLLVLPAEEALMFFDLAPAYIPRNQKPRFNAVNIREFVNQRALYFGFNGDVIRSPSRFSEHVQVRARISEELRDMGYSLPSIGRALCRHHSSILSLLRGGKQR